MLGELLLEEDAEDRAVGPGGAAAWAVDVEEAQGDGGNLVYEGPVHHELLSEKLGETIELPIEDFAGSEVDEIYALEDGAMKLSSYGNISYSGYGIVNFLSESGNPDSFQAWDKLQLDSAGTQLEWEESETGIAASYNSSIEPQPLPGFSDVTPPAPTAFTIDLKICGAQDPVARTYARYLLRLDSQGQINGGVVSPLPEDLRVAAAFLVEPAKSE